MADRKAALAAATQVVAHNRKARHDYEVLDTYEVGIVLLGTEVKSLREGSANLKDSYATVEGGEVYLHKAHISPYTAGNRYNHDPERPRKLLLHRSEIRRLVGRTQQQGLTLIPLRVYFRGGRAKVELALARGRRHHDRREDLARRQAERDVDRALKDRQA
ncbi:MAG: SsrA-binding protein SmpB [Candidatus Latescibacterota bacterium]